MVCVYCYDIWAIEFWFNGVTIFYMRYCCFGLCLHLPDPVSMDSSISTAAAHGDFLYVLCNFHKHPKPSWYGCNCISLHNLYNLGFHCITFHLGKWFFAPIFGATISSATPGLTSPVKCRVWLAACLLCCANQSWELSSTNRLRSFLQMSRKVTVNNLLNFCPFIKTILQTLFQLPAKKVRPFIERKQWCIHVCTDYKSNRRRRREQTNMLPANMSGSILDDVGEAMRTFSNTKIIIFTTVFRNLFAYQMRKALKKQLNHLKYSYIIKTKILKSLNISCFNY